MRWGSIVGNCGRYDIGVVGLRLGAVEELKKRCALVALGWWRSGGRLLLAAGAGAVGWRLGSN